MIWTDKSGRILKPPKQLPVQNLHPPQVGIFDEEEDECECHGNCLSCKGKARRKLGS